MIKRIKQIPRFIKEFLIWLPKPYRIAISLIFYLILIVLEAVYPNKWTLSFLPILSVALFIYAFIDEIAKFDFNSFIKNKSTWTKSFWWLAYSLAAQGLANGFMHYIIKIHQPDITFAYRLIAAPIVSVIFSSTMEELVFRKIVFKWLDQRTNFYVASIVSSVMFAMFHFNYAAWLGYIALGIIWSWVYKKTNNIAYPIVLHTALNLLVFISISIRLD